MFHFIKYLLFALFLFSVLNLFRSNMGSTVALQFNVPYIGNWSTVPLDFNYLLLVSFCVGILLAALAGAFRMGSARSKNREIKRLERELEEAQAQNRSLAASTTARATVPADSLPSLAE